MKINEQKLKIYCVYFEGKYTPEYVERLYNGLKRNCKVDFEFICYSDTTVIADKVIPLPKETKIQQHWHKLNFFNKDFTGLGDIIVLDIDQVVINDITDMVNWPVKENQLVSYSKWWTKSPTTTNIPINGGWYKFKAGSLQYVWEKYNSDPEYWQMYYYNNGTVDYKFFGEQNFVYNTVVENNSQVIIMPGEWVAKYDKDKEKNVRYNVMYNEAFNKDYMILGNQVNEDIKIVHFANFDNTIHEHPEEWIKEYWK
tara:strand:- start:1740 stop:2504 length:765 start_codon:yes stop_codon:yes gene_type:complete